MVHFQIEPLTDWGKPKTSAPRPAVFRAPWQQTIEDLKYEVDLIGGKVIACQLDTRTDDIRRDGMLRSTARVTGFQGVRVSFESKYGPLTYATDAFTFWKDNVRAIMLGLTALRAVNRYGITSSGEQYTGWRAIAAGPAEDDALTPQAARLVFADALGSDSEHLHYLSTKSGVTAAYRAAMKLHHVDVTGGDGSVMRLIIAARDALMAVAR